MYTTYLIFLFALCSVCWARPDTCAVDGDCPAIPGPGLAFSQKCIDRDCQVHIRGHTCGRCNDSAVNGKCCDVTPDAQNQCNCVEPPCTGTADCLINNKIWPAIFGECTQGVCSRSAKVVAEFLPF